MSRPSSIMRCSCSAPARPPTAAAYRSASPRPPGAQVPTARSPLTPRRARAGSPMPPCADATPAEALYANKLGFVRAMLTWRHPADPLPPALHRCFQTTVAKPDISSEWTRSTSVCCAYSSIVGRRERCGSRLAASWISVRVPSTDPQAGPRACSDDRRHARRGRDRRRRGAAPTREMGRVTPCPAPACLVRSCGGLAGQGRAGNRHGRSLP